MKIKLFIGVITLLLLLTGCRGLEEKSDTSNDEVPAASASSVPEEPDGATIPDAADIGITPSPQSSQVPEDGIAPVVTTAAASPTASSPSSSSAAPSAVSVAPKSEVNATLDDIIKELNDLDKLYSQLDDVQDSDLSE